MRNKFNYSAVHKNVMRDRANRSVTEQGMKALKSAFEDAKLRNAHREEILEGKQHEK
ncbi:hypothetical protein HBA43_19590 [Providencia rettgeri]|uniref:Uncharacterized protein n=1 Tax=Providencia rettgeri TaxID=587 RepID=A0AAE2ZIW6_PRORE|nr:hypothetical protein [Providencia rettgeri]MBW3118868.1 hypothetical protein [Providencia rettgeri]NIA76383.1 hypothetical protein [Providencia rettgeri]NIA80594.1 hypothetical protein [Providencia rettgeri]NIB03798.1 hypothetical protein [Providencia rettgeri]NIB08000.1 hypothetical protein [Providencia rettgeri]